MALNRLTGRWRYPVEGASGDPETMTEADIIYWLYKTSHPIKQAVRGSGLENYFEHQRGHRWHLPRGFRPECELTLSATGDLMNHPFLPHSRDTLYRAVEDTIFGADISMAMLECMIHDAKREFVISPTAGPAFSFDRATFEVLKGWQGRVFSFMATACNHSLDFGQEGVDSTIRSLGEAGIAYNGINAVEEQAASATMVDRNGIRVGIVSYTFGLNAYHPPAGKPWIVNRAALNGPVEALDLAQLKQQLRHCRQHHVDAAIVHLHWGFEHEFYPRPRQLDVAHRLAEIGFDVVIGHHPHVVQPVEFYRTQRDPERVVPIFYSLGNLVNPFSAPYLCRSDVARITLTKGQTDSGAIRTYVKSAEAVPITQVADLQARNIRLVRP
jgi:poly-gamma-glutamate synthesis protein (capsule biosynthesis protein)